MKIKSFKCIPIHYTLDEIFRAGTYQVKNRFTIVGSLSSKTVSAEKFTAVMKIWNRTRSLI